MTKETLVFDASPLVHFTRAGKLAVLEDLVANFDCVTTKTVLDELQIGVTKHPVLATAMTLTWMTIVSCDSPEVPCPELDASPSRTRRGGAANVYSVSEPDRPVAPTRTQLAASFRQSGVAAAYAYRPPYPPELFAVLDQLVVGSPRTVLDIGAGDGALARPLAERVDRVDAVDASATMVEAGRRRPSGDRWNLVWHVADVETMQLPGPYGLVTAGASLHWMDSRIVLARLTEILAPSGVLAIVDQKYHQLPWQEALKEIIVRYSRNPSYDPDFSLPDELERLGRLRIIGRHETAPMRFVQDAGHYVEQFHSTASLARELMSADESRYFDTEVEALIREFQRPDGTLLLSTTATVVWGRPTALP